MKIIEDYYYIIISVGLFIMFALLGYLIELSKKSKQKTKDDLNNNVIDNSVINEYEIDTMENNNEKLSIDNDILNK